MRRLFILFSVSFFLAGCPQTEQTIESTICYIREINNSSRNIYIQYYYKIPLNNNILIERIRLSPYSEYNNSDSNYDNCDPGIGYGDLNYRSTPDYTSPIETIEKIVIIDADLRKVLKKTHKSGLVVELENAKDNYDMRCRFEYYVLNITNEFFDKK